MKNEDIGKIIKKRRLELDMSLDELGKLVGVNKSTIMRWENGDISVLKASHVYLLSKSLELPINTLMGLNSKEPIEDKEIVKLRLKIQSMTKRIKDLKKLEELERYIRLFILAK